MYVVTFYSYKGGVGRTMTLVNVAAELARRGRKVLLVDFDLEAPGLTTYDFCKQAGQNKGLVDYITEYTSSLIAPKAEDFITKCELPIGDSRTDIWVMSAGKQDASYRARFHSINWENLYSKQSGFLLFEDLKEQWRDKLNPDYVFIDSRTGHTDVSGICTRQLPDAVVITFAPNMQNLSGLPVIVSDIRAEKDTRQKNIHLHFVASNTPDVDDEDGILKQNLIRFRDTLKYDECNVIHYYNNLALLDQVIFTLNRPKTRLAHEYGLLTNAIIQENSADKDGALAYLEHVLRTYRSTSNHEAGLSVVDARLTEIEKHHSNDGNVLAKLGELSARLGRTVKAIEQYEHALDTGDVSAEAYRVLAGLYRQTGSNASAIMTFKSLLERQQARDYDVYFALRNIADLDESAVADALELPSVRKLDAGSKIMVLEELRTRPSLAHVALKFASEAAELCRDDPKSRQHILLNCALIEIRLGHFRDAMGRFGQRSSVLKSGPISDVFNFAMAEWGETKIPPHDLFARAKEIHEENAKSVTVPDANYAECLAIVEWALGNVEAARDWLDRARDKSAETNRPTVRIFSCWNYLWRSGVEFRDDLQSIAQMFLDPNIVPAFMRQSDGQYHSSLV